MSASGASEALTVLEERGGGGAVLAGSGIGVPDLFVLTSNTSVAVVVRETGWASALLCVGIKHEVAGA